MPQIQTLSSTQVQGRKAETLNSQSIRKTVAVRDIDLSMTKLLNSKAIAWRLLKMPSKT